MIDVFWSPTARKDLNNIHGWLASRNIITARRIIGRIEERVELLQRHPLIGVSRTDIAPSARMLSVPPYIILYEINTENRASTETVLIVRIVDARRELSEIM